MQCRRYALVLSLMAIAPAIQSQIDHWETAVYTSDNWRYLVPSSEPDTNWRKTTFNALTWNLGPGGIGYGDGDDNTIISNALSLFMRRNFTITDTSVIEAAVINIDYDDAFVVYLNNVEIARSNITSNGPPPYNQQADGYHEAQMYQGNNPDAFILDKAAIRSVIKPGTNTLSLQVHNQSAGSSDMSAIAFLHFGLNTTAIWYGATPAWFVPPVMFSSSNLPIMIINTNNQNIVDDPPIQCDMGLIYNGNGIRNYLNDPYNAYNGKIKIELRGSSSQSFPKKPYGFSTIISDTVNLDISWFNWPKEHDWVLNNPYSDKSLIRNILAYDMGRRQGHWAPRTQAVELVLDGDYKGVYVLTEKIKKDSGRVDISTLNSYDTLYDELTGGYILKIDKLTGGGDGWISPYPPYSAPGDSILIQYHYPKWDVINDPQKNYIRNRITAFEQSLNSPQFMNPASGYLPHINRLSFIDYYIVNEVSRNVDGYRLSTFIYKDKITQDTSIHMGPLWDFNLGFGNADYCDGGLETGWAWNFNIVCPWDGFSVPFWWERMLLDSTYDNATRCRWEYLRQRFLNTDSLMTQIDSFALYLDESQQRNFQRWPILGTYIWPNNYVGNTYNDEITYLKTWITNRMAWLDANIPGTCWFPYGTGEHLTEIKWTVYPNPCTDYLTVALPESRNHWEMTMYDVTGRVVLSRFLDKMENKSRINVSALLPGAYLLKVQDESATLKSLIIKK